MSALKKWFERRQPDPKMIGYGSIGVYLSKEQLQIVQLQRRHDNALGIRSHVTIPYPGDSTDLLSSRKAVQILVRRAMKAGNFRGRTVVSAMPPEQVRVMSVSYPASNAGNDVGAITRLMADRLEGDLREYVIDFVPIRKSSSDGDRVALVAVSRTEQVNRYLAALDSAGLHVDYLEIGPIAIQRLISWGSGADQFGNVVVVNIGEAASNLTTISGNCLLADQEIKFGEDAILDALAKSLSLDRKKARELVLANGFDDSRGVDAATNDERDPEIIATLVEIVRPVFSQLVREIERAFLYADSESHGDGTKKLFITGGVIQWPGAMALLNSLTSIDLETLGLNHLPSFEDTGDEDLIDDHAAAKLSTAVGLAMRGMLSDE